MVWSHGKRHSKQIAEQLTFNVGDIIQRDFRPVCEHHPALKPVYLFEVSILCHIRSAGLLCIRDEVGYGQSGMVAKSFHEDLLLPIQRLFFLFTDYAALDAKRKQEDEELAKEKRVQQAMLTIKKKFGKNAILKGMNLEEGATAKDRNAQIGGHKA